MTACPLSASLTEEAYECSESPTVSIPRPKLTLWLQVDTSDELNSCGGCIFRGDIGAVDCETLPGVAVGGVVCESGGCVISDCEQGWRLKGGVCVRR